MISTKAWEGAAEASQYYLAGDYHCEAEDNIDRQWFGKGAESLGLKGDIENDRFTALLHGDLGNGVTLGRIGQSGDREHKPGWDVTFSAPKSISLLALGTNDEPAKAGLIDAHITAVKEAAGFIEKELAVTRVKTNGVVQEINTGNIVAAMFTEGASRRMDPSLHTHVMWMNATQTDDGQWRSIESRRLYQYAKVAGHVYQNALAREVIRQGHEIRTDPKRGFFDDRNVGRQVLRWFSKRRQDIENAAEKFGYQGRRGMEKATLRTRPTKQHGDMHSLQNQWNKEAKTKGADLDQINRDARARANDPNNQSRPHMQQRAAAEFAMKNVGSKEAVFDRMTLLEEALKSHVGRADLASVQRGILELEKAGKLVEANLDTGRREMERYTTDRAIQTETYMIEHLARGVEGHKPIVSSRAINSAITEAENQRNIQLSDDQRSAVNFALTSKNSINLIQGFAGTGKTTMLDIVRELGEARGYTFTGMAATGAAAEKLGQETGMFNKTLASALMGMRNGGDYYVDKQDVWVVDEASLASAKDITQLLDARERTGARLIIVGDRFQKGAVNWGRAFGNFQDTGHHVERLTRYFRPQTDEATDRFVKGQEAVTAERMERGKRVSAWLDAHRDSLVENRNMHATIGKLVKDYMGFDETARANTLVLIPDNHTRHIVNEKIRAQLKKNGSLDRTETTFSALDRANLTDAERSRPDYYQEGMLVKFTERDKKLGVRANEMMRVIDSDEKSVTLQSLDGQSTKSWDPQSTIARSQAGVRIYHETERGLSSGDKIVWTENNPNGHLRNGNTGMVLKLEGTRATIAWDKGSTAGTKMSVTKEDLSTRRTWDHAYALTYDASQGQSVDRALVLAPSTNRLLVNLTAVYTALTRSKQETKVYTDSTDELRKSVSRATGIKTSALEAKDLNKRGIYEQARRQKELEEQREKDRDTDKLSNRNDPDKEHSEKSDRAWLKALSRAFKPKELFQDQQGNRDLDR